jgi:hypothetical protein
MTQTLQFKRLEVVGARFQAGVDWAALRTGDRLELIPEPTNEVDSTAVAVYAGATRIGYLARERAEMFSPLLIHGYIKARVQLVQIDPWVERRRFTPILIDCEIEKVATPTPLPG